MENEEKYQNNYRMDRTVRFIVWNNLFYVYLLARIWLLNHARNDSGLFLHLDKCHAKGYILRYRHVLTVYAISLCFYNKMRYAVKLWAHAVQYAPLVRQNTGRNTLQVRKSPPAILHYLKPWNQFKISVNFSTDFIWNFDPKTEPTEVSKKSGIKFWRNIFWKFELIFKVRGILKTLYIF